MALHPAAASWTAHDSPELGKPFFVHVASGRTSWQAPPPGDHILNVPPQWCVRTGGDGLVYFRNEDSGESSWNVPVQSLSSGGGFLGLASFDPMLGGSRGSDEELLPVGWSKIHSPGISKPYYFNEVTGLTSWERP